MNDNNVYIETAMNIILNAGDARNLANEAIKHAKQKEFVKARELIIQAKEAITLAHSAQTTLIQDEARGNGENIPLLFIHAQDTLMTIMSEINLREDMIDMYELLGGKSE